MAQNAVALDDFTEEETAQFLEFMRRAIASMQSR